jgi:hypothetical protein
VAAKSQIRALVDSDLEQIVELSLLAWEPAFESMEKVLGPRIFRLIWPDWKKMPASLPDADRARRQAEGASQAPAGRRTRTTPWLPNSAAASSVSPPTS